MLFLLLLLVGKLFLLLLRWNASGVGVAPPSAAAPVTPIGAATWQLQSPLAATPIFVAVVVAFMAYCNSCGNTNICMPSCILSVTSTGKCNIIYTCNIGCCKKALPKTTKRQKRNVKIFENIIWNFGYFYLFLCCSVFAKSGFSNFFPQNILLYKMFIVCNICMLCVARSDTRLYLRCCLFLFNTLWHVICGNYR